MKTTTSKRGRPGPTQSGASAGPRKAKAKAAEVARDPKVTAPVAASANVKTSESRATESKPADERPEAEKPATAAKDRAPTANATRKPTVRRAPRAAAKAAAPAAKVTKPASAPVARSAPAAKSVRDLARAVQATTAGTVEAAKPAVASARAAAPAAAATPKNGVEETAQIYAGLQGGAGTVGRAVTETAASTARGFAEFNGKMLEAFRAQSDAAFAVWRETLTAGSLAEAVRAQTSGLHRMYETSIAQWKSVTEAATRLAGEAAKPMQSVWPNRRV
jgi:hypothetical protein